MATETTAAQQEQAAATARGARRQDKATPLLIRDDGLLFPNVPLVRAKANFRPYRGNPKATLEDRMRYLDNLAPKRAVNYDPDEAEAAFELGKATAGECVQFALEQYGVELDEATPIRTLRMQVFRLSEGDNLADVLAMTLATPTATVTPPTDEPDDAQPPQAPAARTPRGKRGEL